MLGRDPYSEPLVGYLAFEASLVLIGSVLAGALYAGWQYDRRGDRTSVA